MRLYYSIFVGLGRLIHFIVHSKRLFRYMNFLVFRDLVALYSDIITHPNRGVYYHVHKYSLFLSPKIG